MTVFLVEHAAWVLLGILLTVASAGVYGFGKALLAKIQPAVKTVETDLSPVLKAIEAKGEDVKNFMASKLKV